MSEFRIPKDEDPNQEKYLFHWRYVNGLIGIVFTFGVFMMALKSRRARSWRYGTGRLRGFIADYGVPLLVVVWTGLSYAVPTGVPEGVPRRLVSPMPWQSESMYHWTVVKVITCAITNNLFMATNLGMSYFVSMNMNLNSVVFVGCVCPKRRTCLGCQ